MLKKDIKKSTNSCDFYGQHIINMIFHRLFVHFKFGSMPLVIMNPLITGQCKVPSPCSLYSISRADCSPLDSSLPSFFISAGSAAIAPRACLIVCRELRKYSTYCKCPSLYRRGVHDLAPVVSLLSSCFYIFFIFVLVGLDSAIKKGVWGVLLSPRVRCARHWVPQRVKSWLSPGSQAMYEYPGD